MPDFNQLAARLLAQGKSFPGMERFPGRERGRQILGMGALYDEQDMLGNIKKMPSPKHLEESPRIKRLQERGTKVEG
jgi:hypothetical protein